MRISDWSSDVCSSDLLTRHRLRGRRGDRRAFRPARRPVRRPPVRRLRISVMDYINDFLFGVFPYICMAVFFLGSWARFDRSRSEEHTSELQSLMRISYAVFCLKKKKNIYIPYKPNQL